MANPFFRPGQYNRPNNSMMQQFAGIQNMLRVHGHLTCSINGIILDTWDCSNEKFDKLWIVN